VVATKSGAIATNEFVKGKQVKTNQTEFGFLA